MPSRKIIATLVGLAGCVAVAWGSHGLMLIGECGGDGAPACPPEATPFFIALGVGMPTAIISGIAGGRLSLVGLFAAAAVGGLWAAYDLPPGERTGALVMGGIFAVVTLLPLLYLPFALRKRRRAAKLVAEGATAIGTVTGVRDTGVTINRNPRVELTLRIEPQGGSASFEGRKTIVASRVALPYEGKRYPVWYDRGDRTSFLLGTKVEPHAPPDVRRMFALAQAGDPGGPATAGATPEADPLDRLAKLHQLHLAGALTEAEYETQKAKLLAES